MSPLRQTHTFAELEVSPAVYDEIRQKLEQAGYHHALWDDVIDMHGVGLVRSREPAADPIDYPALVNAVRAASEEWEFFRMSSLMGKGTRAEFEQADRQKAAAISALLAVLPPASNRNENATPREQAGGA